LNVAHRCAGVVRSALGGHSLALTLSSSVTKAGPLPSDRVVRRGHRRYYEPLGLPLRSARFRLRLIRATLPRRRRRRRVSRVQRPSLNACCAPYPAWTRRASGLPRTRRGLRRDMSGSAPGLFLCRGCRLHLMLRPAFLLPAARLSPPDGLSTPRSGTEVSLRHLGPATRRSGAYRGGTCTRWKTAARNRRSVPNTRSVVGPFTAHHGRAG
jgi:hypothetical protein